METIDIVGILMRGVTVTVSLLAAAGVLTFIVAFIAGLSRVSRFKTVRLLTTVYVEFFRGTSLLVQLFWIFFVLPQLFDIRLEPFLAGVVTLGLNYGAYASEIVRSAILAVPEGQTEAAIALNMSRFQRMRRIILPQALRTMLPGFGNISIELLKGTSLVSLITLQDMMYLAQNLRASDYSLSLKVFAVLLVMYFVLALPLIILSRYLERRASRGVAST
ncbi:ectoine/hydroxyectoine ABC transporter permease subunit EhuC [Planomicrobium sp. CPCC 101079]|uniref:ectoine/hydroxyectoine ABC transporter permease subunit EhuC n=1 Tax=Planomicrobium sp. CPCC 101079 TaxID=2599618 RepID=UPI0011B77004|nr:ectoine/hydroxyectoine ABC transporter permease subunit EhuC [Planomicrobium sp. CPCC 101079]TWT11129.1 ectoine/hydroxyectoine ABC transporter permease subunit EhuC [Planomicrobium sp. CPCC 101079]